ncbi:unnamed protein product [Hymenolepis diminuta]|uniref:Amino acid transporter n=1 Tax=Hymenolepis diminuta TaxID=6216 RepID=A0A0R3SZ19_HYMDI|nr:unnamed protein product [Hymenolepis diminuta]
MESRSKSGSSSDTQNERPKNKFLSFLMNNWFILATITGVGVGFGIAFVIRATHPSDTALTWIAMSGDIYLRILTLTILPLIVANIFVDE